MKLHLSFNRLPKSHDSSIKNVGNVFNFKVNKWNITQILCGYLFNHHQNTKYLLLILFKRERGRFKLIRLLVNYIFSIPSSFVAVSVGGFHYIGIQTIVSLKLNHCHKNKLKSLWCGVCDVVKNPMFIVKSMNRPFYGAMKPIYNKIVSFYSNI